MPSSTLLARARLISGLVLMAFVFGHLVNAALGLASIEVMDFWRGAFLAPWRILPGKILLYGSLGLHAILGLVSAARRTRLSLTAKDLAQVALGLITPFLLLAHLMATRIAPDLADFRASYAWILAVYWKWAPNYGLQQVLLVAVVWMHGCIGLLAWLNLRPWWPRVAAFVYPPVFLLPIVALLGFVHAGDEALARLADDAAFRAQVVATARAGAPIAATLLAWQHWILVVYALVLAGVVGPALWARLRRRRAARSARVHYLDGPTLHVPVGVTLLDVSRRHHVPHSAVCSGHARCGTCRVRVGGEAQALSEPHAAEREMLARLHAGEDVRLACQAVIVRPGALEIERLVAVDTAEAAARDVDLPVAVPAGAAP